MRAKVCGIRSWEDAAAAIRAGADAIGFLVGITHLAEDKISRQAARDIIGRLPPLVSTVLVTHLTDPAEIVRLAAYLEVTTVQIHDYIPASAVDEVRRRLPGRKVIKAVHVLEEGEALALLHEFEGHCDAVLLDSRTGERLGGTGQTHDWGISAKLVERARVPVILAGGLTPDNVYDAVRTVRPYSVDVNSGVEDMGHKSYEKVRRFVEEARRAELERE